MINIAGFIFVIFMPVCGFHKILDFIEYIYDKTHKGDVGEDKENG